MNTHLGLLENQSRVELTPLKASHKKKEQNKYALINKTYREIIAGQTFIKETLNRIQGARSFFRRVILDNSIAKVIPTKSFPFETTKALEHIKNIKERLVQDGDLALIFKTPSELRTRRIISKIQNDFSLEGCVLVKFCFELNEKGAFHTSLKDLGNKSNVFLAGFIFSNAHQNCIIECLNKHSKRFLVERK